MSSARKETKQTFEHSIKRLEEIVEELEQGSVPLDDALKMYEEGIELSKSCIEKLKDAEVRLQKLSKDMEGSFRLVQHDDAPEPEE
jgi:exodeoxyribonuclease VII small subunit